MKTISTTVASLVFACGTALSVCAGDIPEKKQTKLGLYLTAQEAEKVLKDGDAVLVDIRSRAEVAFLGIPKRANIHIPYMVMPMMASFNLEKNTYDLEINPDFPSDFEKYARENGISNDDKIVLICRSGSRSARAADLLADLGYTQVYSVVDGYEGDKAKSGTEAGHRVVNGWQNAGLEWSYKIDPEQVYPADRY